MAHNLTARQAEVVRLVSLGCTVEEIALILDIASSTADNHKARAMEILGTNSKAILTRLALKHRVSSMQDKLTRTEKRRSGRNHDGWN